MNRRLVLTIDGTEYQIVAAVGPEDALGDFQRFMRDGALAELTLVGGRRLLVNWGRVTAVSVTEADDRLSLTGSEPRWPQRPY